MHKTSLISAMLIATAMPAFAAVAQPNMAGVDNPNDPRAKEAYAFQCNEWAQGITFSEDGAKEKYVTQCTADMAQVWPLGADDSDEG